ncbi:hypothetical protein HanIR_Chr17g0881101 [Helianthus annuus]|nr:hypothetical protein HanIR_Chr17g0881101 [Helianthus annuus]
MDSLEQSGSPSASPDISAIGWGVTLYHFEEHHNHLIVPSYNRDLTKKGRRLDFSSKDFSHRVSLNKVGPSVAHKLQVSLKGGHHNVKGIAEDYKNFSRRLRMFIGDRDAQLVIDKMKDRVGHLPNYTFKYSVENGELRHMF